jgi:hypothetical protein
MSNYDFSGLTESQQELLTFQGWSLNDSRNQPSKATVKKLIERGLVVQHEYKRGDFSVAEYEVPIPVHMAWCAYCSEQEQLSTSTTEMSA